MECECCGEEVEWLWFHRVVLESEKNSEEKVVVKCSDCKGEGQKDVRCDY